ncbi:hypothetical protein [Mesorhizobium abyssinicae]|nr:hypothetical protein [Mesorhizobium sp.]
MSAGSLTILVIDENRIRASIIEAGGTREAISIQAARVITSSGYSP